MTNLQYALMALLISSLIALACFLSVTYRVDVSIDRQIQPMMQDIVAHRWSKESLSKYATYDLKMWLQNRYNWQGPMRAKAIALGRIKNYHGTVAINKETKEGAAYTIARIIIDFEQGRRLLEMKLQNVDGQWRLGPFRWYSFRVDNEE